MTTIRVFVDANRAWNVVRTIGAATQSSKSADGAVTLGATYHVVATLPNGTDHRLYVNGEPVALTHAGAAVGGAMTALSTDEVSLGRPTLAAFPGFAGDLGRVTLWPIAMSASRAKASYRQQNNLAQWVGVGGENASSDTNRAPVAVPLQAALTAGGANTIDVIAKAYDQDGDALSIVGPLTPTNGAASIVSDRVVWTPASSFSGAATCPFPLRDGGGKTGVSTIYATVQPTTSDEYPALTGTSRTVSTAAEFTSAYAALGNVVGRVDHIVLASSFSGPLGTLDKAIPTGNTLVIRAASVTTLANMPTITGTPSITGNRHFFWGLSGTNFFLSGSDNTFRRCKWEGTTSGYISVRLSATSRYISGPRNTWLYCTFSSQDGGVRTIPGSQGCTWKRCHWLNIRSSVSESAEPLILMEGVGDSNTVGNYLVEDCLFENCVTNPIAGGENEILSSKCANNVFRRITVLNSGGGGVVFGSRFGHGCRYEAIRLINTNAVRLQGFGHILNSVIGRVELAAGNWDSTNHAIPDVPAANDFPSCAETTVIGGTGVIVVGDTSRADRDIFPAKAIRIEGHPSGVSAGAGQGSTTWTTVATPTTEPVVPVPNYTAADVGVLSGL